MKDKEGKSNKSIIDRVDKKQIVTITMGIIAISLLLTGYFIYSGRQAIKYEEDLLERIDNLNGINETLSENNQVLKNTIEENRLMDELFEDNNNLGNDEGIIEPNTYNSITRTYERESYPNYLDEFSKEYLDQTFSSSELLLYAFSAKLKRGEKPDEFSDKVKINHIAYIDKGHCFVQLVEGFLSANIIYKISNSTGEIQFEMLSYESNLRVSDDTSEQMSLANHMLIRSTIDVQTMEMFDSQIFDSRFMGGQTSPNHKYAMHYSISELNQGVYDILPVFTHFETSEKIYFEQITNQTSGIGLWKDDSSKVLIDETRIYDIDKDEIVLLETMDKQNAIFDPKIDLYDNVKTTKDFIGIVEVYNLRNSSKSQIVLHIYKWNGDFVTNILIDEYNTPSSAGRNSITVRLASTERNMLVIDEQVVLNRSYLVDLDTLLVDEVSRNRLYIPELEWYVEFKQELNNQVVSENAEFYTYDDQLNFSVETGNTRLESYMGYNEELGEIYFRQYGENGFSDIASINIVDQSYSTIELDIELINDDYTVLPYAYANGRFEILEIVRIELN